MGQIFIQFSVAFCGLASVYLSMVSTNPKSQKWAPFVGLCGQPFWVYNALQPVNGMPQYGMLVLAVAFTLLYIRGCWNNTRKGV